MRSPEFLDLVATACFALALLQTFLAKRLERFSERFPDGSVWRNLFHLLGEIEGVFGLWSGIYLLFFWAVKGAPAVSHYLGSLNFTEPAFVFAVLIVCATQPILYMAEQIIRLLSRILPLPPCLAFYLSALTVGPLLGSLITEPAAMTVTALLLRRFFQDPGVSRAFKYATVGLLFVNVSIGGTLTPFAAPPILMVAAKWDWNVAFMMAHFGWKGALACLVSASVVGYRFRREITAVPEDTLKGEQRKIPVGVLVLHAIFLFLIVASAHEIVVFIGLLFFFLGLVNITRHYHNELLLRNGLWIAFFLGGLVVLGTPQRWWLEGILTRLDALWLYLGTMGMTAFTDNAALTYLGSQVEGLTEASRYALVAGSVVGGGMTVIANAPNPVGYGILGRYFGEEGISPLPLAASALIPTLVAAACFWFL